MSHLKFNIAFRSRFSQLLGMDNYFFLSRESLFLGFADLFVSEKMCFKQFFSLDFVMKTIFSRLF